MAPCTLLFGSSSSILVTMTSVVSMRPAMLAAFCRAERVTFVGSTMPALNISTYSPVLALYPVFAFFCCRISSAITAPSAPEFSAIVRIGFSSAGHDLGPGTLIALEFVGQLLHGVDAADAGHAATGQNALGHS